MEAPFNPLSAPMRQFSGAILESPTRVMPMVLKHPGSDLTASVRSSVVISPETVTISTFLPLGKSGWSPLLFQVSRRSL